MENSIEEVIDVEKHIVSINQKIIDTHMITDSISLEEMYCDDTDIINEHLDNYKATVEYHSKVLSFLEKYKKIEDILKDKDNNYKKG